MKKLLMGIGAIAVALVGLGLANAYRDELDRQRASAFSMRFR